MIFTSYKELRESQQKRFDAFPQFYAYNCNQFKRGMEKLGLKEDDTDKIVSNFGGGYILKADVNKYHIMICDFDKELWDSIKADIDGNGFINDMFTYELANHEYDITLEVDETLDALGLTEKDFQEYPLLKKVLKQCTRKYWDAWRD